MTMQSLYVGHTLFTPLLSWVHAVLRIGLIRQYLWSFCYLKGILEYEINRIKVDVIIQAHQHH